MENKSAMARFFSQLGDRISDQVWFQQLKTKWEELDQQSRHYIKIGVCAAGGFTVLVLVVSTALGVRAQKRELAEKNELISVLSSATEELGRLKESGAASLSAGEGPWTGFIESAAQTAGIEPAKMTVSAEKAPDKAPAESDKTKEALIDVSLKKVNIKQVVRFAFQLENGPRPVKVRNLAIDTQPDLTGWLDATVSVSAFTVKP